MESQNHTLAKEIERLLEDAMKQPGVAAAAQVFELAKPSLEAAAKVTRATAPRWVITASNSSK